MCVLHRRTTHTKMLCNVKRCRFPTSHVTSGHRCGTCDTYGHGQMECGHAHQCIALAMNNHNRSAMPPERQCTIDGCVTAWTHETEAHHCTVCGSRGEGSCTCVRVERQVVRTCPHCKEVGNVDLAFRLFTGGDCTICMESGPMMVFDACHHANVCKDCVLKLT